MYIHKNVRTKQACDHKCQEISNIESKFNWPHDTIIKMYVFVFV